MKKHLFFIMKIAIMIIGAVSVFIILFFSTSYYRYVKHELPEPLMLWSQVSAPLAENASYTSDAGERLTICCKHSSGAYILELIKKDGSGELLWQKGILKSPFPLVYAFSWDGSDLVHLSVWLDQKKSENPEKASFITLFPEDDISQEVAIELEEEILFQQQRFLCNVLIGRDGNILAWNSCLLVDDSLMEYFFSKEEVVFTSNENRDGQYVSDLSQPKLILMQDHPSLNKCFALLEIREPLTLSDGQIVTPLKMEGPLLNYCIALLIYDRNTDSLASSVAGPFRNGSLGSPSAHINWQGQIVVVAGFDEDVAYSKAQKNSNLLTRKKWNLYRVWRGLNLSQGLLVFDREGNQQYSGVIANGFLRVPQTFTMLPDGSLGFYTKVSPRAEFFDGDKRCMIQTVENGAHPFVFLQIPGIVRL